MDSSNSGSIQSSSSGDNEDFASHGVSISSYLNFPPPPQPPPPPPLTSHQNHYPSSSFDLLSPYFTAFHSLPPDASPLHLEPTWPKSITNGPSSSWSPYPIFTSLAGGTVAAAVSSSSNVPAVDVSSSPSSVQLPAQSDHPTAATATTRSSKKRSRASRRAPTTVLTTDTSNFRAMVQQFTGFPTPPFAPGASSAAAYSRPRLDLFGGGAAPPYLLRPFAQKVPSSSTFSPLSSSSSSLVEAIAYMSRTSASNPSMPLSSAAITSSSSVSATSSSFRDVQLPSVDLQSSNPLNVQNQNLAFQSVLQPHTALKYDPLSSQAFKVNPQGSTMDYVVGEGSQQNLIAPEGTRPIDRAGGGLSGMVQVSRSDAEDEAEARAKTAEQMHAEKGSSSSTATRREMNSRVSWIFPPD